MLHNAGRFSVLATDTLSLSEGLSQAPSKVGSIREVWKK